MIDLNPDWVVPIVGSALALFGVLKTVGVQKGTRENKIIDQLQEQMQSMRDDIANLKTEQDKSKKRERARDDYISRLRYHIDSGHPPPAPEWPDELRN